MARPRIDVFWQRLIETYASEGYGPKAIERMLDEEARERGRDDCPSERTIGRVIKAWKQRPETERHEEALFRWPEAMELGDLPWEAGEAALEFLRWWEVWRMPRRPTVRDVRWYYRVRLAVPQQPQMVIVSLAIAMASGEHAARMGAPAIQILDLDRALAFASEESPMDDKAAPYSDTRRRVLADKTVMTVATPGNPAFAQVATDRGRRLMDTLLNLKSAGMPGPGLEAAAELLWQAMCDPREAAAIERVLAEARPSSESRTPGRSSSSRPRGR